MKKQINSVEQLVDFLPEVVKEYQETMEKVKSTNNIYTIDFMLSALEMDSGVCKYIGSKFEPWLRDDIYTFMRRITLEMNIRTTPTGHWRGTPYQILSMEHDQSIIKKQIIKSMQTRIDIMRKIINHYKNKANETAIKKNQTMD